MTPYGGEDFHASVVQENHERVEDLPVADETDSWRYRVVGEAALYGLPTLTEWAVCICTSGRHAELSRVASKDVYEAKLQEINDRRRGYAPHLITRTTVTVQTGWEIVP